MNEKKPQPNSKPTPVPSNNTEAKSPSRGQSKSEPNPNQKSVAGKIPPPIELMNSGSATEYVRETAAKDTSPKNKLFDQATKQADQDLVNNLAKFRRARKSGVKVDVPFMPFLLIRQIVGDHGQRPITATQGNNQSGPIIFQQTPDIWVCKGHPTNTPEIPANPGSFMGIQENTDFTIYAHVWNLGRAPIAGVKVEFFSYLAPFKTVTSPLDHLKIKRLGVVRVDLQGRSSLDCHKLVKCPVPFVPHYSLPLRGVAVPSHRLAILVQVSSLGDPVTIPYDAMNDRHVGRRDFLPLWVD